MDAAGPPWPYHATLPRRRAAGLPTEGPRVLLSSSEDWLGWATRFRATPLHIKNGNATRTKNVFKPPQPPAMIQKNKIKKTKNHGCGQKEKKPEVLSQASHSPDTDSTSGKRKGLVKRAP